MDPESFRGFLTAQETAFAALLKVPTTSSHNELKKTLDQHTASLQRRLRNAVAPDLPSPDLAVSYSPLTSTPSQPLSSADRSSASSNRDFQPYHGLRRKPGQVFGGGSLSFKRPFLPKLDDSDDSSAGSPVESPSLMASRKGMEKAKAVKDTGYNEYHSPYSQARVANNTRFRGRVGPGMAFGGRGLDTSRDIVRPVSVDERIAVDGRSRLEKDMQMVGGNTTLVGLRRTSTGFVKEGGDDDLFIPRPRATPNVFRIHDDSSADELEAETEADMNPTLFTGTRVAKKRKNLFAATKQ